MAELAERGLAAAAGRLAGAARGGCGQVLFFHSKLELCTYKNYLCLLVERRQPGKHVKKKLSSELNLPPH